MRDFRPRIDFTQPDIQRRVTISSAFAIIAAIAMLGFGYIMRNNALNATIAFEDEINGIRAQIPLDWLLTSGDGNPVFQVQDPGARPFKTLMQVSVQTVGPDASPRNVVDLLKLQGPLRLSGYTALAEEAIQLGDDDAVRITYFYVDVELNPFLEAKPLVVRGEDVVVLRGNQAIILTYRDADSTFDDNRFHFENFLRTIEY